MHISGGIHTATVPACAPRQRAPRWHGHAPPLLQWAARLLPPMHLHLTCSTVTSGLPKLAAFVAVLKDDRLVVVLLLEERNLMIISSPRRPAAKHRRRDSNDDTVVDLERSRRGRRNAVAIVTTPQPCRSETRSRDKKTQAAISRPAACFFVFFSRFA